MQRAAQASLPFMAGLDAQLSSMMYPVQSAAIALIAANANTTRVFFICKIPLSYVVSYPASNDYTSDTQAPQQRMPGGPISTCYIVLNRTGICAIAPRLCPASASNVCWYGG